MSDEVKAIAAGLKGKKAKLKDLKEEPSGTKEKKLPKDVQKGLEEHFKAKLNKVRVHVGGNAPDICKSLKADAFTYGQNIYLKKGSEANNSRLLAHELTHVLHQTKGKMKNDKKGKVLVTK